MSLPDSAARSLAAGPCSWRSKMVPLFRTSSARSSWESDFPTEPGRWNTARAEYLREIMDTCTDRRGEEVVLQKSAQIGGAEVLLNLFGFHIDQDPAPIPGGVRCGVRSFRTDRVRTPLLPDPVPS